MNVTAKLKATAEAEHRVNVKAWQTLRNNGVYCSYPSDTSYRLRFGPYKVKTQVFESKRFYFDPKALYATSYGWWKMLYKHPRTGLLIRNRCGYSPQTSKHQAMLDRAMKGLGINADIEVCTRSNIGSIDSWRARELNDLADLTEDVRRARKHKQGRKRYLSTRWREFNRLVKLKIFKRVTQKEWGSCLDKAKRHRDRKNEALRESRERAQQRVTFKIGNTEVSPPKWWTDCDKPTAPNNARHLTLVKA